VSRSTDDGARVSASRNPRGGLRADETATPRGLTRCTSGPTAGGEPSDDLRWLGAILWSVPQDADGSRGRAQASPGRIHDRFVVVPGFSRPRLLVPLASSRAAAAAWRQGNNATPRSVRLAKAVLGAGFRFGLAQQVLRHRIHVRVPECPLGRDLAGLLVQERLRQVLGRRDLHVAVNIGTLRINRKPVMQVLTDTGEVVAYAKLGWDALTRGLVSNEAAILGHWVKTSASTFDVPSLIFTGQWRGMELLVTSPVSRAAGFSGRRDLSLPIAQTNDVATLSGVEYRTLSESSFFTALRDRTAALEGGRAEVFSQVLGTIAERYGASTLAFGSWHGDWAPWNMAWHRGRLFVWDWERCHPHVPVGFDALHYFFQVARTKGEGVGAAADTSLVQVSTLSRALNVSRGYEELVLTLYLVTLFLRYEAGGSLRARGAKDISWALLAEAAARVDRQRPRPSPPRGRGPGWLRVARRCHGAQP
jgi:hypothetical protein